MSRRELLGGAVAVPSVGHVEKSGTGYREVLVNWSPTI
jgi:hypothetical protein